MTRRSLLLAALYCAIPFNIIYTLSPIYDLAHTIVFNAAEIFLMLAILLAGAGGFETKFRLRGGDYLFLTYLTWCSAIVIWHVTLGIGLTDQLGRSINSFNRAVLTLEVFWYLIGRFGLKGLRERTLTMLFILSVFVVIFRTDMATWSVEYSSFSDDGLNYLAIADPFAILAFLLIAACRNWWRAMVVWCIAVAAIWVIGSRATLYAFVASTAALAFVLRPRLAILLAGATLAAVGALYSQIVEVASDLGRMVAIAYIAEDPSYVERATQREIGFKRIADNPLAGDYGGPVRDFGNIGAYIHDVSSYWQQFGLVPFLLVLTLIAMSALAYWSSIRRIQRDEYDCQDLLIAMLFPFVVISLAFARSYDWPFAWLLIGLGVARVSKLRLSRAPSRSYVDALSRSATGSSTIARGLG